MKGFVYGMIVLGLLGLGAAALVRLDKVQPENVAEAPEGANLRHAEALRDALLESPAGRGAARELAGLYAGFAECVPSGELRGTDQVRAFHLGALRMAFDGGRSGSKVGAAVDEAIRGVLGDEARELTDRDKRALRELLEALAWGAAEAAS